MRGALAPRIVVPRTAAKHFMLPASRALRILFRAVFIIILIVPIRNPFPYIAGHIIQAQFIGGELSHGRGKDVSVIIALPYPPWSIRKLPFEGYIRHVARRSAGTPTVFVILSPASRRILQLRFRRKTVFPSSFTPQPVSKTWCRSRIRRNRGRKIGDVLSE